VANEPPHPAPVRGPGGIDTAAIRRAWPDVLAKLFSMKRTSWTFVSEHAQVIDYDGSRLTLGIATVGLANTFRRGQHAELVRQALIDVLGVDARVEGVPTPDPNLSAASGEPHPTAQPAIRPASEPPTSDRATTGTGSAADGGRHESAPRDERSRHTSPAPEAGDGGWASATSAPSGGPSWASGPDAPPAAVPPSSAAAETGTASRLQRARAAVAAEEPERTPEQHLADDSAASADDEDIEALGEVGRPVIERLLGGRVIDEGS
jgi:DNA polymerase-3 subunit gamma/tau